MDAEPMEGYCLLACSDLHSAIFHVYKKSPTSLEMYPCLMSWVLLHQLAINKMLSTGMPQDNLMETFFNRGFLFPGVPS